MESPSLTGRNLIAKALAESWQFGACGYQKAGPGPFARVRCLLRETSTASPPVRRRSPRISPRPHRANIRSLVVDPFTVFPGLDGILGCCASIDHSKLQSPDAY